MSPGVMVIHRFDQSKMLRDLRCEGLITLKIVERRLLTIYDGAMANYSCISISNILQTHFEGHAWAKL
jgi:hypothetical protein